MIKKVVIAAAGQGTRMLNLAKNKPKSLINVQRKPFLSYLLDNLLNAGYKELILVVGYKEELMREFLKEYSYKATVVNQFEILGPKEKEYGTACPLKCVKNITGQEDFLAVYGDNLYSVEDLEAMNISDSYTYIAGFFHQHPEKYGVLFEKNGFLEKIVEKPKEHIGNLINTGLYKFTPEIFEAISKIKKSPRGEYELTDAVSILAKKKKVKVKQIQDYWLDFGNPGDILKLCRFLKTFKGQCPVEQL